MHLKLNDFKNEKLMYNEIEQNEKFRDNVNVQEKQHKCTRELDEIEIKNELVVTVGNTGYYALY